MLMESIKTHWPDQNRDILSAMTSTKDALEFFHTLVPPQAFWYTKEIIETVF